jgi:hypothetical protein
MKKQILIASLAFTVVGGLVAHAASSDVTTTISGQSLTVTEATYNKDDGEMNNIDKGQQDNKDDGQMGNTDDGQKDNKDDGDKNDND